GISIGRRILRGRHLIAGEWGHNPLPWPSVEEVVNAPRCYCGKRGCIETWLSGPGFSADFSRASGRALAAAEIIAAADRGEAAAA
ncbi:ROK family protein, partial [Acinetobacter baumannii]